MSRKIRLGVLGIGGVGGYFGSMLAQKYADSNEVEVVFITKESTAAIIKNNGLKLFTSDTESLIYPKFVIGEPSEVGTLDYLICSVKSYDLEASLKTVKNSISKETVILPLLNGVNARERILKIYPFAQVLDGCVYIVAKLIATATVQVTGAMKSLYFGSDNVSDLRLSELAAILNAEGIESHLSKNIKQLIWEKFVFVSPLASLTSYLNLPIGPILENDDYKNILKQLVIEVADIAEANDILLPNIVEVTMTKIAAMPYNATSSMHNDFLKKGRTEFEALTEFVIVSGLRLGIPTPGYDQIMSSYSSWKLHYLL